MADEIVDHLAIHIGEKLLVQSPTSSNCSIIRVPPYLRNVYAAAYEPHILAIGPYNRGKSHLNAMEKHKILYLKLLLKRKGETNVTRYVRAMRALEERARKCYAETVNLEQDQFVEMMLLDGCFIAELLRKCKIANLRENDDPIFNLRCMMKGLRRDLLLIENQIPFFVLHEFFVTTLMPDEADDFHEMTYAFFENALPGAVYAHYSESPIKIKHLVEFIHHNWQPSSSRTMRKGK